MINDQAGINSRKINFISNDDGYSPPKAVEQVRRLVESDEVRAIFSPMGVPSNTAIQKYLNGRRFRICFRPRVRASGTSPKTFPWTMGPIGPGYISEGQIYAAYLLKERPGEKIAVLYQNDDFGKELLRVQRKA